MKYLYFCLLCSGIALFAAEKKQSNQFARNILAACRNIYSNQQQLDLDGYIEANNATIPIRIYLRKENIQFLYKKQRHYVRFHLNLAKNQQYLYQIINQQKKSLTSAQLNQTIGKSAISYEDLAFSFLYWKDVHYRGESKIKGRTCYLITAYNPKPTSQNYYSVKLWVDKKTGAILKIVGYNKANKPRKVFLVQKVMRLKKHYFLQRMAIHIVNNKGKITAINYINLLKPKNTHRNWRTF